MLRAELLSGFRLTASNGQELPLTVRKAKALLAYLAIHAHRLHDRETLACLLWDAAGDRAARQSLRRCLSDLRRALGPLAREVLIVRGARIGVKADAIVTDIAEFSRHVEAGRLQLAVGLIGGGVFLDGLEITSEPFQDWLRDRRTEYSDQAVDVLTALAEVKAQQGRHGDAIDLAQRALDIDPLHDDLHQFLIAQWQRIGQFGAARRQHRRYGRTLRDDLQLAWAPNGPEGTVSDERRSRTVAPNARPRVIVPALRHGGTQDGGDDFAAGLHEEIVGLLAARRWLDVVPEAANGEYLVAGSVRPLGAARRQVRIRLDCSSSGRCLASDAFEVETPVQPGDQHRLARAAASRLVAEIEQSEGQRRTTSELFTHAIDCWQHGNRFRNLFSREGNARARKMYEQAIALDPEFAPAYASLAYVEQFDAFFGYADDPKVRLARGLELARTAISIDRLDPSAYIALGRVLSRMADFDGAAAALETGLSLCPGMEEAEFSLGLMSYYQGRQSAALERFGLAFDLNPRSPSGWKAPHMLARCHYDLGQFEEALFWANRAVNAPHAKSIAFALKAAAAARSGHRQLAHGIIGYVARHDPAMTASYVVRTFGNEFLTDAVEALAEQLCELGLSP